MPLRAPEEWRGCLGTIGNGGSLERKRPRWTVLRRHFQSKRGARRKRRANRPRRGVGKFTVCTCVFVLAPRRAGKHRHCDTVSVSETRRRQKATEPAARAPQTRAAGGTAPASRCRCATRNRGPAGFLGSAKRSGPSRHVHFHSDNLTPTTFNRTMAAIAIAKCKTLCFS